MLGVPPGGAQGWILAQGWLRDLLVCVALLSTHPLMPLTLDQALGLSLWLWQGARTDTGKQEGFYWESAAAVDHPGMQRALRGSFGKGRSLLYSSATGGPPPSDRLQ